ncbi:MAG: hypothetical protein IJ812_09955, partial [Schwartzia sp.]|nr:hypothetical protein [Schwartzia sp. (in: firmicutes)]
AKEKESLRRQAEEAKADLDEAAEKANPKDKETLSRLLDLRQEFFEGENLTDDEYDEILMEMEDAKDDLGRRMLALYEEYDDADYMYRTFEDETMPNVHGDDAIIIFDEYEIPYKSERAQTEDANAGKDDDTFYQRASAPRQAIKKGVDDANKREANNLDRAAKSAMEKLDAKAAKAAERDAKKKEKLDAWKKEQREKDIAEGRIIQKGNVEIRRGDDNGQLGLFNWLINSPSRLAEEFKAFKPFFVLADKAMKKLTRLREIWSKDLSDALAVAGNKESRGTLYQILLDGDAEGKNYTDAELKEKGASEEIIKAYQSVRKLLDDVIYPAVDDARRRAKVHTEEKTRAEVDEMKKSPFYDVLREDALPDGKIRCTYKEFANWKTIYTVDKAGYDKFKKDDAIQILKEAKVGEDRYTLEVREMIPPLTKKGGYIPHFFHNYFVYVVDKNGETVKVNGISGVIGSGRTEAEAFKIADEYEKDGKLADGQRLVIQAKTFNYKALGVDEGMLAVVLGDKDYTKMMRNLEKTTKISLEDARKMIRKNGRNRFYGQALQRKGAGGFEKDMEWVLQHHVNMASRYVAMQDFKPEAIKLYEAMFGDFRQKRDGLAGYIQDYINDVNGVPSSLEKSINATLNSFEPWRKYVVSRFGDRAALQLVSTLTGSVSIAKLGFLNVSSALLNLTQIANAAAYIGEVNVLWNGIRRGAHGGHDKRLIYEKGNEKITEQKVLDDTGVQYDIGLDSAGGYDKFRPGDLFSKSMVFFKASESAVRRGTVLAAYKSARERGMNHEQAIDFADEVNRKSNFEYGVHDAPNMFRRGSIFSQIVFQFKKYPIKQLEVMRDMMPYLSDKASPKQKAIFWGTYFMLAGLFQIPFGEWLEELAEMAGFKPGPRVRKWMMEAAGDDPARQALAKIAMYGLPSVAGVDISQRYGLGGVLPSDMYEKDPTYLKVALSLMGASTDTAKRIFLAFVNGVLRMDKDETFENLRGISPGISNLVEAATGERYDKRGRVMTKYDSTQDRILKALGFRSTKEAVTSDVRGLYYDEKEEKKNEKQKAIDRYLDDPTTENAKKLRELGVKPDTVKKARQQRKLDNLGRTGANMTKQEKKDYEQLMKFAR